MNTQRNHQTLLFSISITLLLGTWALVSPAEPAALDPNLLRLETAAGRVVEIMTPDTNVLPALFTLRDASGTVLATREIQTLSDPALSPDRTALVYRTASGAVWFDLESAVSVELPMLWPLAAGPGQLAAGITVTDPKQLIVFERGVEIARCAIGDEIPRGLAFACDGADVWLATQSALYRCDPHTPALAALYAVEGGDQLHNLRVTARGVQLVVHRAAGSDLRVTSLLLDGTGHMLDRTETTRSVPPCHFTRADLITHERHQSIPWPIAPDSQHPIGNTYGEYQNYGGSGYLHPGCDVMGNPGQPVYAVHGGQVKAILTTSGEWHWRIAIADQATGALVDGYLYAHVDEPSVVVHVGDIVTAGQYLGNLVEWPVANFTHCHFSRVRDQGTQWFGSWLVPENAHLDFHAQTETTPPVFERAVTSGLFAFCTNQTSSYQSPTALHGSVDIVVRVGDRIACNWLCSVQVIRYDIYPRGFYDHPLVRNKLAVRFDMADDFYQSGPINPFLLQLLYKNDTTCPCYGDYDNRRFNHIITNSDGDDLYEQSDMAECWNTTLWPDWDYYVVVTAFDVAGNVARDSMMVTTDNNIPSAAPFDFTRATLRVAPAQPDPACGETQLVFELAADEHVHVSVFDSAGRLVRVLANGRCAAGRHAVAWDARDRFGRLVPAGAYFFHVQTPRDAMTRRVVRIRG